MKHRERKIDLQKLNEFLETCGPNTKIYLGCDSKVLLTPTRERYAAFTTAIVVHIDGQHGGKLFYETVVEKDFSISRNKPSPRLMNEVYKVSEMYLRILDEVENALDKDIEIHLDINPNKEYKSSAIVQEALGYIQGTCQVHAKVKPDSWAAMIVADKWVQ